MTKALRDAKTLREACTSYLEQVLPADASAVQVGCTRDAFYSGAWAMFALAMNGMGADQEPTPEDIAVMDGFVKELEAFREEMQSRAAEWKEPRQ